jgi:hypothetical protein
VPFISLLSWFLLYWMSRYTYQPKKKKCSVTMMLMDIPAIANCSIPIMSHVKKLHKNGCPSFVTDTK